MKVESEDFGIPVPPRTSEPCSPSDPVTFLEARDSKTTGEAESSAWIAAKPAGAAWRRVQRQAVEVTFTVLAMCCWIIMCILDLWAWDTGSGGTQAVSLILSLGILAVSCIVFATRQCCVSRILRKDPNGMTGAPQLRCQLLILLASQWSLLGGAIIWFVFHASSGERLPQVIAGLVAVFILLVLLLCSLVYVLVVQRRTSAAKPGSPKEHADVATRISHLSEDLALASIDPQADLDLARDRPSTRSYPSIRSSLKQNGFQATTRSEASDDAMSDNYIGHVLSSCPNAERSNARSSFRVQVNVEATDDEEKDGKLDDGGEMRKVKSVEFEKPTLSTSEVKEELIRSSCRWRPLFPTMASANCFTPTASRTSMLSLGGELRRGTSMHSSKGFRFETEAEVEQSLAKEIKRHTLEVNSTIFRSSSPSPSLGSLPSQQSSKKVKSSRASSSSGLTDDSGT